MKKIISFSFFILLIVGCSTTKRTAPKKINHLLGSSFFESQFTGILVLDSETKDTLISYNSKKYFTPASNTKILTLFTSISVLPNTIPAFKYIQRNDTLFIAGTGDPTFLHAHFKQKKALEFLKKQKNIALYLNNFNDEKYGQGWAWDDYSYYYQPEKSSLPLYGNVVTVNHKNKLTVTPSYFKDSVIDLHSRKKRALESNTFFYSSRRKDTLEIPFKTSHKLTQKLLQNAVQQNVSLVSKMPEGKKEVFYSVPSDSVYKRMMHESDNFIAEQLLLLGSSMLSDTLNSAKMRKHMLDNYLSDLKQPPRWVDGSGLSRYNLITPETMVNVLDALYKKVSRKRLFSIFPAGGVSGSLENEYHGDLEPYIYAKSGSLSNNYCLSGYLLTKSGKTLIFSFMNNHFKNPSKELKKKMTLIFEEIRDTY